MFLKKSPVAPQAALLMACLLAAATVSCSENPVPAGTAQDGFTVTGDGTLTFQSRFNGEVQVADKNGQRSLNFVKGGKISSQSRIDLEDPALLLFEYTRCALLGPALFPAPRRQVRSVLMIGLGAGSLQRFFQKHLPAAAIDTVELDPLIVELARKYFFVTESDRVKIHVDDGRAFVEKTARRYDMAIIDAFNADNDVPRQLTSLEFLRSLKARLAGGGVVVTNFINNDDEVYQSILATYARSFKYVTRCDLDRFNKSNIVIISSDDPGKHIDRTELVRRVDRFSAGLGEPYDLRKYAEVCEPVNGHAVSAPVIRDR